MAGDNEQVGWMRTVRLDWLSFLLTCMGIAYMTVIANNDMKNDIKSTDARLAKAEALIIGLQDKKLDKETFNLILTTLTELRSDIRDLSNQKKL